ncbi:MAG: DUF4838 domain-containing protein [Acidobacteriota bacterium]
MRSVKVMALLMICSVTLGAGDARAQGVDSDGDGWGDPWDNCPWIANPTQEDADQDGIGDVCDQCDGLLRGASLVIDAFGDQVVMDRLNLNGGAKQRLTLTEVLIERVAEHFDEMTGVPFKVTETAAANPGCLAESQAIFLVDPSSPLLGSVNTPEVQAAQVAVASGSPETHAVISYRSGGTWLIARSGRGLLRAAYAYLEELGARFLLPHEDWTILPTLSDLAVDLDVTRSPVVGSYHLFASGGFGPATFFSTVRRCYQPEADFAAWRAAVGFPLERVVETGHSHQRFYADRASGLLSDPLYFAEVPWTDPANCDDSPSAPGRTACLCGPSGAEATCQARPTFEKLSAVKLDTTYHGEVSCSQSGATVSFVDRHGVAWCEDPTDYTSNGGTAGKFSDWVLDEIPRRQQAYPDLEYAFFNVDPTDSGASLHDHSAKSLDLLRSGPYGALSTDDASNADKVFHLANHVAEQVEQFYPGVGVGALSYNGHSQVPTIPLRHNVAVQLVPGFQFGSTFTDWKADWLNKQASSPSPFTLGFFEHLNYVNALASLPRTPIRRFFARIQDWHGSAGISFATLETTSGSLVAGPYLYALSRMIWDPSATGEAALDELITTAFGPAAPTMRSFFALLYGPGRLDDLRLARYYELLTQAYNDLGTIPDPSVLRRLDHVALYVEYQHLYWQLRHPVWEAGEGERVDNEFVRVIDHLYRIHDLNVVQTWRSHFLLLSSLRSARPSASVLATYDPSSHPRGWADALQPHSRAEIDALVAAGRARYALPADFEARSFSGPMVRAQPSVPPDSAIYPSIHNDRSSNRFLVASDGLQPTKIAVYTVPSCSVYDPARRGRLVVQDVAGNLLASTSFALTTGQGAYTAYPDFAPAGLQVCADGAYDLGVLPAGVHELFFEAPSGTLRLSLGIPGTTPFVTQPLLQPFGILPGQRAYFYVPSGARKVWLSHEAMPNLLRIYPPSLAGGLAPRLEFGSTLYSVDVPPGDDGQVWSVNQFLGSKVVQFLNAPDHLAPSPQQLLVPDEALGPKACFKISPETPVAGQLLEIDMSCSAGSPVAYKLWLDYQYAGQPPVYWGSQPTYRTLPTAGSRTLRVEVIDAAGRSSWATRSVAVVP